MRLRSLLFVPGDRPDRMEKALGLGADALILDLEDAVAPSAKDQARRATAAFLRTADRKMALFVRVNSLDSGSIDEDLAAVLAARPDGLMLPKAHDAACVEALAAKAGGVPILPIAAETSAALFQLGSYQSVTNLLAGITWGAEDLSAALGARTAREEDGRYTAPCDTARSLTLFAAHAADVAAIDTVYPAFRDLDGLSACAARARRDGFTGMLAIHPDQVPVINAAFTPTAQEMERAHAIVAAFEANPEAGALQLEGKMIDMPHLKQARSLLAAFSKPKERTRCENGRNG